MGMMGFWQQSVLCFQQRQRRRTNQIDANTSETSCLTIVWETQQDSRLPRIPGVFLINTEN
jgi:hypothetical protein